jgi:hypothetical protein
MQVKQLDRFFLRHGWEYYHPARPAQNNYGLTGDTIFIWQSQVRASKLAAYQYL